MKTPIIGSAKTRDPLADFKVKVTKADCKKGFHGLWKVIGDEDTIRTEQCMICGEKQHYSKITEGSMDGRLDEMRWLKNHKLDMLQPYLPPDGLPNPDYFKYYGDPTEQKNPKEETQSLGF